MGAKFRAHTWVRPYKSPPDNAPKGSHHSRLREVAIPA